MKRFLLSFIAVISFMVAMVPVSVALADSGIKTDACVDTGVKIGDKTCIPNDGSNGGAIVVYLQYVLKFLSAGIGVVVLLMLVIAGIQYITSSGDPALVKAAKDRIINAITALVLFAFGFAILSFIVPGGIL